MFDGLLLFRPLSPILSESDMTAQFENLGELGVSGFSWLVIFLLSV